MYFTISILSPWGFEALKGMMDKLGIPITLTLYARGTATNTMMDILGLTSREKRVSLCVADEEKTNQLIKLHRQKLYVDAPGNGVVLTIPMKSVGGGKNMAYLTGGKNARFVPQLSPDYELIVAVVGEGFTDIVMDAARQAGASGGTVLHGKGTGGHEEEKFYTVSLAHEREVVLIVARVQDKAQIMKSILRQAGPDTQAGTVVFSLPVSQVAGIGGVAGEGE